MSIIQNFTKKIAAVAVAAAALSAATAAVEARPLDVIKQSGEVVIGVFSDKAPFGYVDSQGKYAGYDVYFGDRLAKDLGVKVKYISVDPASRVEFLVTGKVDIILANFTVTKDRAEKVDFALPYMKVALGVVSPESAVITDVKQLDGKTLIIAKGTTAEPYFEKNDGKYSEVDISNLTGPGGIFKIDLDWQTNQGAKQYTEKSDFIKIGKAEDNSSQTVWFDISKAHLDEMKDGDKLYFASVGSGDTTFSTNADGEVSSADEIYSFKYSSQSEESDNLTYWFLTKSQGGTNENVALLRNAALASYSLASDLDRFHERRDEARYEEAGAGGLWARYRYSDIGRDNTFDMDKNMIQVGYDKEVSTADSRKIVGIAFDYTHADTDLTGISGSGSNDRYALNLYYSVLADCGGYADFTAKIGRLGSDYDLRNQTGQKIGSSFWQTFYGVSAEFGWRYALNDTFFIEPQTQLQIIRIEGDQFETDGGIKAQIADTNSVIGRIGLRAGSTFTLGSAEQKSSAYVFADALREFKGDYAFAAAGHSTAGDFTYSGKESWYDAGIGTNVALSSNINFRLNAKYIFGGVFESSRQIDAAIHFAF